MAVAQGSGRSRYRLLLLILTAVTLLTLDFRGFGPLATAQSRVRDVLEPVVSAVDVVLGPVAEVWTVMFSYNDLRSENAQLKDEVERLSSADIRVDAQRDAFDRLLSATGVTYVDGVEQVAATVLRDSVGNFDDDVMSIDVGHRHGVAPGMAVVTSAGFVGRVETVDAASSTVTSVSDPRLVIGVRLLDTGDVGARSWNGWRPDQVRGGCRPALARDRGTVGTADDRELGGDRGGESLPRRHSGGAGGVRRAR